MLMVIFGAGASYDSVPTLNKRYHSTSLRGGPYEAAEDYRPPLANELFEDRRQFLEVLDRFPQCQPIIPFLRHTGGPIEKHLEELQAEANKYPERHRQLVAVRYYMQSVIWQCVSRWNQYARGVTNHKTLIDEIERVRGNQEVCFVTFNYDLLIEQALASIGLVVKNLDDYIRHEYRLIKLHGSVNWGRPIKSHLNLPAQPDGYQIATEVIRLAPDLQIGEEYVAVLDQQPPLTEIRGYAPFPAIAIPVETKKDFECPPDHIAYVKSVIPNVDKLLVVGWRAADLPFVSMLAESLSKPIRAHIIAGSSEEAHEISLRLQSKGI